MMKFLMSRQPTISLLQDKISIRKCFSIFTYGNLKWDYYVNGASTKINSSEREAASFIAK